MQTSKQQNMTSPKAQGIQQQQPLNEDINYFTEQNLLQQEVEIQQQQQLENQIQQVQQQQVTNLNNDRPITPQSNMNPLAQMMGKLQKPQTAGQNNNQDSFNMIDETMGIISQDGQQRPQTAALDNMGQQIVSSSLQNLNNVTETLAKAFAKKINQKKSQKSVQEETKQSINELRFEFQTQLAKVYENDTREEGIKACFKLIQKFNDNPQALKVILGSLCDKSSRVANSNKKPLGLMSHVQMFGFVAKIYKDELKDPKDAVPSLIKTVVRVQEAIYSFFTERDTRVLKGCAVSLADIIDNCFPDKTQLVNGNQSLMNFFFEPLLNFHKGGKNTMMQLGASYCIMDLIDHFQKTEQLDLLEQIHLPIMQTTNRYKVDNEFQLVAAKLLVQYLGIRVAKDYLDGLIGISTKVINQQSNAVSHKKAACDLLCVLAEGLKDYAGHIVPSYQGEVMKALDTLKSEKQIDLSKSRNDAVNAWNQLQTAYDLLDPAKKESIVQNLVAKNLQNKFSKLRDQAKETQQNKRRAQSAVSRIMNDVIKDEINQSHRIMTKDFLKKGKGQGGGAAKGATQFSPSQSKDKKLYDDLKRIQELNSIMRTSPRSVSQGRQSQQRLTDPIPEIDESNIFTQQDVEQLQQMNKYIPANDIISIDTNQYLSPRSAVQNYKKGQNQQLQQQLQPHQQRLQQLNQQNQQTNRNYSPIQNNANKSPQQRTQELMNQMGFNNQNLQASQQNLEQLQNLFNQQNDQVNQGYGDQGMVVTDEYGNQHIVPNQIQYQQQQQYDMNNYDQQQPQIDFQNQGYQQHNPIYNNYSEAQTPMFQSDQQQQMINNPQQIPQQYYQQQQIPNLQVPQDIQQYPIQQQIDSTFGNQQHYQQYDEPQQTHVPQNQNQFYQQEQILPTQQTFQDSLQPTYTPIVNQQQQLYPNQLQQQPIYKDQQNSQQLLNYPQQLQNLQENEIQQINPVYQQQVGVSNLPQNIGFNHIPNQNQNAQQQQYNQVQQQVPQQDVYQQYQQIPLNLGNEIGNQNYDDFEFAEDNLIVGNQAFNDVEFSSPNTQYQNLQQQLNTFTSPVKQLDVNQGMQRQLKQQQQFLSPNQNLNQLQQQQQFDDFQQNNPIQQIQQYQQQHYSPDTISHNINQNDEFETQNIFTQSPNTQQRMIEEQRQQLKQQQQNLIQKNPQLMKYQQQKEFLEDKFLNQNTNNNSYTNGNDVTHNNQQMQQFELMKQKQEKQQILPGFISDPDDIDQDQSESPGKFQNAGIQRTQNALQNNPVQDQFMDSLQPNSNNYQAMQTKQQIPSHLNSKVTTQSTTNYIPQNSQLNPQVQNLNSQQPFQQQPTHQQIKDNTQQINNKTQFKQSDQRLSSPFIEKELPLIQEEDPDIDNCESDINDRDQISTNAQNTAQKFNNISPTQPQKLQQQMNYNNNINNIERIQDNGQVQSQQKFQQIPQQQQQQQQQQNYTERPQAQDLVQTQQKYQQIPHQQKQMPQTQQQLQQNHIRSQIKPPQSNSREASRDNCLIIEQQRNIIGTNSINPNFERQQQQQPQQNQLQQQQNQPQKLNVNLKDTQRRIIVAPTKQQTNLESQVQQQQQQNLLPHNQILSSSNSQPVLSRNTQLSNAQQQPQIEQQVQSFIRNQVPQKLPPLTNQPNLQQLNQATPLQNQISQQQQQKSMQDNASNILTSNKQLNQPQTNSVQQQQQQNSQIPVNQNQLQQQQPINLNNNKPNALPPLNQNQPLLKGSQSTQHLQNVNNQIPSQMNVQNPNILTQANKQPLTNQPNQAQQQINNQQIPLNQKQQNTLSASHQPLTSHNNQTPFQNQQQVVGQNIQQQIPQVQNKNAQQQQKGFNTQEIINTQSLLGQQQQIPQQRMLSPINQISSPLSQQKQSQHLNSLLGNNSVQGLNNQQPIQLANQNKQFSNVNNQLPNNQISQQQQSNPNQIQNQQQQQQFQQQNMKPFMNNQQQQPTLLMQHPQQQQLPLIQGNTLPSLPQQQQFNRPTNYTLPNQNIQQPFIQGTSQQLPQQQLNGYGTHVTTLQGQQQRNPQLNVQNLQQKPIQQQQIQPNPAMPGQATQLITQQILLMQKQMEQGFAKMCEKIEDIEGRVDNASNQLQQYERQFVDNQRVQEQKDLDNQQQFRRLSETVNSQQQMLFSNQKNSAVNDITRDEREPRFRSDNQLGYQQPPLTQNLYGHTVTKSPQRQYQSKLTQVWNKVLELVKKRQFEEAYRLTMKEADDIYLIRLVAQTGPVVKQLEDQTAFQVINRINKIIRSGAFEAMEIEWIEDANRRGLFQQLTKHEQNEYLDTLYQFSQSKLNQKISDRASQVYSQIKLNTTVGNNTQKKY